MAVTYREYHCKSMLRFHKYVDNWFWSKASLSPYRACSHGCHYCDGRSEKYHASEDFDAQVMVKINAPEILKKELDSLFPRQRTLGDFTGDVVKERRPKPLIMVSSGVSDAYQPAEKEYELTRRLLEILRDYDMPVFVMTKSDLVLRDIDLLRDINDRSWGNVSFSLSTVNEGISRILEPGASPPSKRLKAMKTVAGEGILTGVTFLPIIPYITDTDGQLNDTVSSAKENRAGYILAGTMTMRDAQAAHFCAILEMHFPELVERYKKLYRRGYEPDGRYMGVLHKKVQALCRQYGVPNHVPRYIPDVVLKKNIEVSTMLFMIAYFLGFERENRYTVQTYQRLASAIENMDENLIDLHRDNTLDTIPGIGKNVVDNIREFIESGHSPYLRELMG